MADDKKVIFSMSGVTKTFQNAQTPVLKNIYLSFFYGAKIGILGLNGSGKSTLLKIIAGVEKNFQGDVVFAPGYTVGFLEQEPLLDESKTVIEIVKEGVQDVVDVLDEYHKINDMFGLPEVYEDAEKMEELMAKQAKLQDEIDAKNAWELDTKLNIAMDALRTPEPDKPISVLSGGERRRVALCRLLLKEPDVLLLDEPTNHLDAESVHWLEHHLSQYKGTVIAVTHDRYFLDNVAGWILELDRGEGIPWKGNYSSWLEQKSKRLAQEQKQAGKRQKTLERELEWVRMAPKGRQAKQKARLQNYDKLMSQDQKQLDEKLEIYIPNGPRLGTNVIEAKNVAKGYGDKLLYEDLNFKLPQAGIVGIIGPNGAGKTTIFKMIMGEEKADKGSFEVGDTAKIAYVDQAHSNINANKTIWENFSDSQELVMMGGRQINSRAYLSRFNFSGSEQNKKVSMLSGGERNRLHLAMTLKEEGNVLLLDEPTNDLDVNTLRALEEGLENFAGCAVVISHDRWFLDRVCTHILSFEGDSQVYFFEGSFSDYEENKKKRLGGDLIPKRLKYKKINSLMPLSKIKAIAFDADDTLWVNETLFRNAEKEFCVLMQDYLAEEKCNQLLFEVEMQNLPLYGYGIKPFTLSLIEAAIRFSDGNIPMSAIQELIDRGKEMLDAPIELLDGVEDTLEVLSKDYRLVMATKGDLLDQERKLVKSGLEPYFHHIEIVSDKTEKQYQKLVNHLDIGVEEFLMVGNSLKSDILPVLGIGSHAFHIPFHTTWIHEQVSEPVDHPNFRELKIATDIIDCLC